MATNVVGYAHGSLAGVDYNFQGDDVKIMIIDGGNLKLGVVGVNQTAADGTVVTQVYQTGVVGATFGVIIEQAPVDLLDQTLEAIMAALLAGQDFLVILDDDYNHVNFGCTWDFNALPRGPSYPSQRTDGDYVGQVTMRFIVTSDSLEA